MTLKLDAEEFYVVQAGLREIMRSKRRCERDRTVANELWNKNLQEYEKQREEQNE